MTKFALLNFLDFDGCHASIGQNQDVFLTNCGGTRPDADARAVTEGRSHSLLAAHARRGASTSPFFIKGAAYSGVDQGTSDQGCRTNLGAPNVSWTDEIEFFACVRQTCFVSPNSWRFEDERYSSQQQKPPPPLRPASRVRFSPSSDRGVSSKVVCQVYTSLESLRTLWPAAALRCRPNLERYPHYNCYSWTPFSYPIPEERELHVSPC